jgi:hypothetical protein
MRFEIAIRSRLGIFSGPSLLSLTVNSNRAFAIRNSGERDLRDAASCQNGKFPRSVAEEMILSLTGTKAKERFSRRGEKRYEKPRFFCD